MVEHRRDPVAALAELVAFPTVSNRPTTEIVAFLATWAEDLGMRVSRYESGPDKANLVVRAGPEGTDGITLSGHLDVVPVAGQAWTSDPFRLTERDGRLLGRGSCDMKGFVAATMVALGREELDVRALDRELALVWTHDEEVGCVGSRLLVEAMQAEGTALPAQALIGEPTSLSPRRLHPGHLTWRVVCTGIPAHSSRPALGLSAVRLAAEVLAALEGFSERLERERAYEDLLEAPWSVLNVGRIQGGSAVNIVPGHCVLDLGIRPLPGVTEAALSARLEETLAPVARRAEAAGGSIALEPRGGAPALLTRRDAPLLGDLAELLGPHTAGAVPFATDGSNLARLGLDCVVCGPGSIDLAHRPDESIGLDELHGAVDFVSRLVRRRCLAG